MSESTSNAPPETVADLMPQTPDLRAERLAVFRKLFPDLFNGEGHLQERELRALIDPAYHPTAERYEFPWTGKTRSKREAFTPSRAALVYDKQRSVNPEKAGGNVIIEGENLEVLKQLTAAYRERVKLIYIDPPYNTGKDFVYSDDYTEGRKPYWEESGVTERGVKVDTNSESEGRFHSNWLSMMYARLIAARYLLREDGLILISIGDTEFANLRRLCDAVFGEENCRACVTRGTGTPTGSGNGIVTSEIDYILIYARSEKAAVFGLPLTKQEEARYDKEDKEGRYLTRPLRKTGGEDRREDRPSMHFPVKTPDGNEILPVGPGGYESRWRCGPRRYKKLLSVGRIEWVKRQNDEGARWVPYQKFYLKGRLKQPSNLWTTLEGNKKATRDLKNLLGGKYFDNPKSVGLLRQCVTIAAGRDDLILDFFGGSGTTAQAVMDLNAADGGNRRFILVQLPEFTREKSAAYKAGYKKISDITIERNKRVIERYRNEATDAEAAACAAERRVTEAAEMCAQGKLPGVGEEADDSALARLRENARAARAEANRKRQYADSLGFKVYALEKSHFPRVDFAPDPDKTEAENVELLRVYIREKENTFHRTWDHDHILDEVLLKNGFMFDRTIEPAEEFEKNRVELVKDAHRAALVCLDESIAPETVDAFKGDKERTFICLEAALDTTKKWNLKHHLGDRLRAV